MVIFISFFSYSLIPAFLSIIYVIFKYSNNSSFFKILKNNWIGFAIIFLLFHSYFFYFNGTTDVKIESFYNVKIGTHISNYHDAERVENKGYEYKMLIHDSMPNTIMSIYTNKDGIIKKTKTRIDFDSSNAANNVFEDIEKKLYEKYNIKSYRINYNYNDSKNGIYLNSGKNHITLTVADMNFEQLYAIEEKETENGMKIVDSLLKVKENN